MRRTALISCLFLMAGCVATPNRAGQDAAEVKPRATPVGEPVSCISTIRLRQTQVRSDRVVDFEMLGGEVYRNTLPNRCPQLGVERRFAYEPRVNQLCSVDIIRVLTNQGGGLQPLGACGLGNFQRVQIEGRRR